MTHAEVDHFFNEYVFGFMFSDISREVELARSGASAGNFLAALGLLCYTEVMGGIEQQDFGKGARQNFDTFFARLGTPYRALAGTVNVYKVFRCGMAHEYLVKRNCTIEMLDGGRSCGIERDAGGRYFFNVERYFRDFSDAGRALHADLLALADPIIPKAV